MSIRAVVVVGASASGVEAFGLGQKSALSQRMADAARSRGSDSTARRLEQTSTDASQASGLIRDLIPRLGGLTAGSNGAGRGVP